MDIGQTPHHCFPSHCCCSELLRREVIWKHYCQTKEKQHFFHSVQGKEIPRRKGKTQLRLLAAFRDWQVFKPGKSFCKSHPAWEKEEQHCHWRQRPSHYFKCHLKRCNPEAEVGEPCGDPVRSGLCSLHQQVAWRTWHSLSTARDMPQKNSVNFQSTGVKELFKPPLHYGEGTVACQQRGRTVFFVSVWDVN